MFPNRVPRADHSSDLPPLDQLRGRPIGRVLTKMGKVTQEQVIEALRYQREHGAYLGDVMVKLGFIERADVIAALAGQRGERPLPPAGQAG